MRLLKHDQDLQHTRDSNVLELRCELIPMSTASGSSPACHLHSIFDILPTSYTLDGCHYRYTITQLLTRDTKALSNPQLSHTCCLNQSFWTNSLLLESKAAQSLPTRTLLGPSPCFSHRMSYLILPCLTSPIPSPPV